MPGKFMSAPCSACRAAVNEGLSFSRTTGLNRFCPAPPWAQLKIRLAVATPASEPQSRRPPPPGQAPDRHRRPASAPPDARWPDPGQPPRAPGLLAPATHKALENLGLL